jgi:hypothetical protein
MQLVAYGAQDIYLTGNPQITFFKVVYRRHTNFSMEAIQQTWNGSSTTNGRCTATISRNGDLVHKMYIVVGCTAGQAADSDNIGVSWIQNVELEIGGQRIDKQSGVWMEAWAELTEENSAGIVSFCTSNRGNANTGCTLFQNMAGHGGVCGNGGTPTVEYNVPLQFWFCRNPGLSLPLIALQYHEVKVILDHTIATHYNTTNQFNQLWADYIYLDTDERRRFAQQSHEYLIEQVQEQSLQNQANNELNFNHPVKELVWTLPTNASGSAGHCALSSPHAAITNTVLLKLNGHDRFAARPSTYFTRTQVHQHHSGYGGLNSNNAGNGQSNDSIAVYSFALKPEEHQPSGTCNFSRIDNAQLVASANMQTRSLIFAVNYNVLRIMSGMGGLAYSN